MWLWDQVRANVCRTSPTPVSTSIRCVEGVSSTKEKICTLKSDQWTR